MPWKLDDERLLPVDPATRRIASGLYEQVRDLPIVSPHGHVPAQWLASDEPFADPATLLITPDHYVTRLLHASGIDLADLGVGQGPLDEAQSRRAWRLFCEHWPVYRGTPVRFWMESELVDIFGVTERPSAASADAAWERIAECLAQPQFRPRALYEQFRIEVLATTDDPCDTLEYHRALADDPNWHGRVIPSFRPDRYLEPAGPDWPELVATLGKVSDVDTGSYEGFIAALEQRRRYFVEHGAVSADHSHFDVVTLTLSDEEAGRIYAAALRREATAQEATALRRHLFTEMARMSVDDGLVMTVHPGVVRGHHGPTGARFGPDTGHDIPVTIEFTRALQHLLERFGTAPGFHLVIFTLDETVFSREVAPLAGFYPSVYAGAPWWFIDAPDAIRRYRRSVTEIAGFSRTSGFIDDTRAFCSIPARHDMSRRLDCGYLAELVAEGRLEKDEAAETARDLVTVQPKQVFKL